MDTEALMFDVRMYEIAFMIIYHHLGQEDPCKIDSYSNKMTDILNHFVTKSIVTRKEADAFLKAIALKRIREALNAKKQKPS